MTPSKRITITADIELPTLPNFFRTVDGQSVPISAVKEEDLRDIGAAWTEALVARAEARRKDATI